MMFTLGDKVRWSSQAQGCWKEKVGVVEQVVPAGGMPDRERFPALYKSSGVGASRDHESYVVRVRRSTFYWPRANKLELEGIGGGDEREKS